ASKAPQWAPVRMPFWAGTRVGNCSRAVLTALARALFGKRPASRGRAAQAPSPLSRVRRERLVCWSLKKVMGESSVPALMGRAHVAGVFLHVLGEHARLLRGEGGTGLHPLDDADPLVGVEVIQRGEA